ncbi:hypothetical protein FNF29_00415 [Cafeteria roenbergensis]|uniref:Palmitoyltransferase n=1 Tax=Cafeteria roenbergensis TaxID=33653 RepID=A0A5A8CV97_CAFRO|nr:hypothetical protein FNF29_00415 [Cafeteria roenbergensis]|eukprot:KAA0157063.1 hypothetical protein FNF29_00415 [Cafeteria roenbergensis]
MNAFDGPIHWQQIATSGAYVFVTILGLVTIPHMFSNSELPLALSLTIYLLLAAVCVASWLYIELTDPSMPGGVACPCMKRTQSSQSNCSLCRKPVVGLDHHCYFLNTCIGKRNYAHFFALSLCSTLQMAAQVVFSVLGMTVWIERGNDNVLYYVLVGLQALIAAVAGGATCSLLGFHVYLLWIGMGTYDWMWAKQDKAAEKVRRENQARFEAEQQARLQLERERQQAHGAAPAMPAGRVAVTVESHPVAAAAGAAAAAGVGGDSGGGLYAGFEPETDEEEGGTAGGADTASSPGDDYGGVDAGEGGAGAESQDVIGMEYADEAGGVYDDDAAGAYDDDAAGGAFDDEGREGDGFGDEEDEADHERVQRVPGASSAGSTGAPSGDSAPGSPTQAPTEEGGAEQGAEAEEAGSPSDAGGEAHGQEGAEQEEAEDAASGEAASGSQAAGEPAETEATAEATGPEAAAIAQEESDADAADAGDDAVADAGDDAGDAAVDDAGADAGDDAGAPGEEEGLADGAADAAAPAAPVAAPEGGPEGDSCDSTGRPGSAGELQPETATPRPGEA